MFKTMLATALIVFAAVEGEKNMGWVNFCFVLVVVLFTLLSAYSLFTKGLTAVFFEVLFSSPFVVFVGLSNFFVGN